MIPWGKDCSDIIWNQRQGHKQKVSSSNVSTDTTVIVKDQMLRPDVEWKVYILFQNYYRMEPN